jgi:hypothetical protein
VWTGSGIRRHGLAAPLRKLVAGVLKKQPGSQARLIWLCLSNRSRSVAVYRRLADLLLADLVLFLGEIHSELSTIKVFRAV